MSSFHRAWKESIQLRPVCREDCYRIWRWANDPVVRAQSFNSDPIPWEAHVVWFESKVDNRDCVFLIAVNQEHIPVGQIRFDMAGDEAVVSVSVAPTLLGQGYGKRLIRQASMFLFGKVAIKMVHAYVKTSNHASIHAFTKAGYLRLEDTTRDDQEAAHLILRRSSQE